MAPGQCRNRALHAHSKKKSIKTALNKGRSWKQELFKFLLDYRTTPHCTTGVLPATILFVRTIKNRPSHLITPIAEDPSIREHDTEAKRTIKQYADRKLNDLRVGDTVVGCYCEMCHKYKIKFGGSTCSSQVISLTKQKQNLNNYKIKVYYSAGILYERTHNVVVVVVVVDFAFDVSGNGDVFARQRGISRVLVGEGAVQ